LKNLSYEEDSGLPLRGLAVSRMTRRVRTPLLFPPKLRNNFGGIGFRQGTAKPESLLDEKKAN
jgi:hypothetical protein